MILLLINHKSINYFIDDFKKQQTLYKQAQDRIDNDDSSWNSKPFSTTSKVGSIIPHDGHENSGRAESGTKNDHVGTIPCVGSSELIIQQCVIAKIFHLPMS